MARAPAKKTFHRHGCKKCHYRYDDNCETPEVNGQCTKCRTGHCWQLLRDGAAPRDCCRRTSELASKDDRTLYALRGDALWFICAVCKRTFPYDDPKREGTFNEHPPGHRS